MNRFKKAATLIVIAEVLIIIALNVFYLTNIRVTGRYYRVEAERIVRVLEADET